MEDSPVREKAKTLWEMLGNANRYHINNLIGRLCTLVDSSLENERQCKAFKDMVKQLVWSTNGEQDKSLETILLEFSKEYKVTVFPDWLEKRLKGN